MIQLMSLYDWSEIQSQFNNTIILGNGASIAVDNRLSYHSLYEKVCDSGRLNNELVNMFKVYNTTNFEYILKLLLEARRVNEALNISDGKTEPYYYELRDSLISTIREVHPTYNQVELLLPKIYTFLQRFQTVLSLNYDLLVYWAMLTGNKRLRCQWFKDCFLDGKFRHNHWFLRKPQPPAKGSTLVFYPHGSLFIATNLYSEEAKLSRNDDTYLLEAV